MLDLLTTAIGLLLFALLLGAALRWLLRRAAAESLLGPVLVGGGLRLVVMLVVHFASVSAGDGGTFYLDDAGFANEGSVIAGVWLDGSIIDLSQITGSLNNGFQILVAGIFALVGTSVLAVKLVTVLLGTATVLVAGMIGARLFGDRGKVGTAWAIALLPTLIWWSGTMLKEPLAMFLVAVAVLAVLTPPSLRSVMIFAGATIGLTLTRPTALAAVIVGTAVAYSVTAIRHRRELDWRVLRAIAALAVGGVVGTTILISGGDPQAPLRQLADTARSMFAFYGRSSVQIPIDWGRIFFVPFPWNVESPIGWDRALIPGIWLFIAMTPTAALGIWRLRRREELLLLLVPILTSTAIYAVTAGAAYRQRSGIELLFALLFVAGFDSARRVAQRAAVAIGVTAPLSLAHIGSPATALLIVAGAGALLLIARHLPDHPSLATAPEGILLGQLERVTIPDRELVLKPINRLRGAAPSPQPLGANAGRASETGS